MNASELTDRTIVEQRIMEHIDSIRQANNLSSTDETYNYIISNWYYFDAIWLKMVVHMKESGRLK